MIALNKFNSNRPASMKSFHTSCSTASAEKINSSSKMAGPFPKRSDSHYKP